MSTELLRSLQRDVGNAVVSRLVSGRGGAPPRDDGGPPGAAPPRWIAPLELGEHADRAGAYRALAELRQRVAALDGGGELSRRAQAMLTVLGMGRGGLGRAEVDELTALGDELAAALQPPPPAGRR